MAVEAENPSINTHTHYMHAQEESTLGETRVMRTAVHGLLQERWNRTRSRQVADVSKLCKLGNPSSTCSRRLGQFSRLWKPGNISIKSRFLQASTMATSTRRLQARSKFQLSNPCYQTMLFFSVISMIFMCYQLKVSFKLKIHS